MLLLPPKDIEGEEKLFMDQLLVELEVAEGTAGAWLLVVVAAGAVVVLVGIIISQRGSGRMREELPATPPP